MTLNVNWESKCGRIGQKCKWNSKYETLKPNAIHIKVYSYSYGPDHSKTKPFEILTNHLKSEQNGGHFAQMVAILSKPYENQTPFKIQTHSAIQIPNTFSFWAPTVIEFGRQTVLALDRFLVLTDARLNLYLCIPAQIQPQAKSSLCSTIIQCK